MQQINIHEAKTHLSRLLEVVSKGEEVIIAKHGKPVAILSAYTEDITPRKLGGSWEGKVKISEDFNDCDDEIAESFYNSSIFPK
jgi:prevent-host-death family protein